MKKFIGFLILFIILNISTFYVLLFTSFGNGIVAPIIEENVNKKNLVDLKIDEFILRMDRIELNSTINNGSKLSINGDINIFDMFVDLKYDLKVDDLSKYQKLTKEKLNGEFFTHGTIKGDKNLVEVLGFSDFLDSDSSYNISLKNFKLDLIDFNIKNLEIEKLLFLVNQPRYADGKIDINGKIKNVNIPTLNGKIVTKIYEGHIVNDLINQNFDLELNDKIDFNSTITTHLNPYKVDSSIDFYTTVANIFVKSATVNLKDKSINSDYILKIDDLSKLKDITKQELNGKIVLSGDILKSKDLIVSGKSDIFGGNLKFNLFNDDFKANLINIEALQLTQMLSYPEVFDSKASFNIAYNIKDKSGDIKANLLNGHFVENEFSALINNFAKFDITREVYKQVSFDSHIQDNSINSKLIMNSNNTIIDIKKSIIDLETKNIDTNIDVFVNKVKLIFNITGKTDNPKVSLDTTKVIKNKLKEKAKEKITNDLGKKIDEKLGNSIGSDLIKSIFE
jgi:hypothetical protein